MSFGAKRKQTSASVAAASTFYSNLLIAFIHQLQNKTEATSSLFPSIHLSLVHSEHPVVLRANYSSATTDASTSTERSAVCSKDSSRYTLYVTVILASVITLVALTTIAGNLLVIVAFASDRKLRSFGNYFILNLAISDLIVGLLICVYMPYILKGCWLLTRVGCLVFNLFDYVVPLASAWNMALISLDRYCSVARPVDYRMHLNTRRAVLFMTIPWIAGTLWYGPTVLFWTKFTGKVAVPDGECQVEFYEHAVYLITCSFVEFLLPFATVASINILIYLNIRRRSRGIVASGDGQNAMKAKHLLSRDKKSARSLAILIVVFLFTWGPFEVCSFVNPLCSFCIPPSVFDVVFWLLWLNSTINPILYPFLQQRFRVAFGNILRQVIHRRRRFHGKRPDGDRSARSVATTVC